MIFRVLISIILGLILYLILFYLFSNIKFVKLQIKRNILNLKIAQKIANNISILSKYSLSSNILNKFSALPIIFISIIISILVYFLSILSIRIFSTSILLSLFSFSIPYILIDIMIQIKMGKIKTILPSYIVNLKSNIEVNNNIIKSINMTKVEEPLKSNIDIFNTKVNRGINVYKCFDELKESVNIENFTSLISAFKVCYANGGDYTNLLNKYINITSKENMQKAKLRESSNTTILTLCIMILINIFLLFSVILQNNEYSKIILETTAGHIIINFGIISYGIIAYFVYKIYKMEG